MPRTFLATLQYDGTHFVGWQRQREGRTVQQELETVLARLAGQQVRVHAAGRTDAGVHALGMGVSFTLPDRWTPAALQRALNALLPDDCFAAAVREARAGFHARRCAMERRYEYRIGTDGAARSPFRVRWEWALDRPLDPEALTRISEELVGRHDFGAFAVRSGHRPHTRCDLRVARWTGRADGAGVRLEIAADRFLHHMVRIVTATVVDVALGRRDPGDVRRLLARDPGARASAPAPAAGLFFVNARYPETWFEPSAAV
jgi:tRNA pseudouridine38-40 synthase